MAQYGLSGLGRLTRRLKDQLPARRLDRITGALEDRVRGGPRHDEMPDKLAGRATPPIESCVIKKYLEHLYQRIEVDGRAAIAEEAH